MVNTVKGSSRDAKSERLAIRTVPALVAQINKPLTIAILAIFVFVLILAFVAAFRVPVKKESLKAEEISVRKSSTSLGKTFATLPGSYRDRKQIDQYLQPKEPVTSVSNISTAVQQELDSLREQQSFLRNQLAGLAAKKQQEPSQNTVQLDQAKTSGLFFPGGAPPREDSQSQSAAQATASTTPNAQSASRTADSYQQQNMQSQKMEFLKSAVDDSEEIYGKHRLTKPVSPYEVQAGTIIPATLITAIETSLPGDVVAQVQDNIFDTVKGIYLLIPKGSKILGKYQSQIAYGQERILIVFYRIIRPDGSSILLNIAGADLLGQAGMGANVNNHWARVLGAATLSTLLSVGAGVASDNTGNNNTYYRSASQNAVLGASSGISQTGEMLTNRAMNIQPTLTVPAGYQFNVIVNKDIILEPYHQGLSVLK